MVEKIAWSLSILELRSQRQRVYKVTRAISILRVSETKLFSDKEKALAQFKEWSMDL